MDQCQRLIDHLFCLSRLRHICLVFFEAHHRVNLHYFLNLVGRLCMPFIQEVLQESISPQR